MYWPSNLAEPCAQATLSKPRAEQEAQSQPSQHSDSPVQVSRPAYDEQSSMTTDLVPQPGAEGEQ